MKPIHLSLVAVAALVLTAGCTGLTGLPAGSADNGDTITVRYSAKDADGHVMRLERSTTFVLGSGGSGLGLAFERELRGHRVDENITFALPDDPTEVDRELQGIPQQQDAPRREFEANVGPASVGQTFPAFGIYTATVTGVTADRVNFTIDAQPHQRNDVSSVGAVLVSDPDGETIHRTLDPTVGATFVINPPTQSNPQTPLGLAPGSYKTLGATATKLQYGYSPTGNFTLIGHELHYKVTILRLTVGDHTIAPECKDPETEKGCDYAVRPSPYVNGDPESVLGAKPAVDESETHTH